jgi:tRNA threonylcarbamoyladenosine biosynthesis protein TsaE
VIALAAPLALHLADEAATQALGRQLARVVRAPLLIGLVGELGTGKTTLVRALVQALLPGVRVKSPTYTLIESYASAHAELHHLDLYRLRDPAELEDLGIADLLTTDAIVLVEWPERGGGHLPALDLELRLDHALPGRNLVISATSPSGQAVWTALKQVLRDEGALIHSSGKTEKT